MPETHARAVTAVVGSVLLASLLAGCGDDGGPAVPTDSGPTDGSSGDGGRRDAGSMLMDGGAPMDSGGGADAGSDADAGTPGVDAGPTPTDAGPTPTDAGPAPTDAGPAPLDAGPAPVDGGPAPVDAGPAPVDAGFDAGRDAGTDAGFVPTDAGPPVPTCTEYCTAVQAACTGGNAQYASNAACMTACSTMAPGSYGMTGGNTIGCRLYHAGAAVADPATHCPHAGPTGGGVCI